MEIALGIGGVVLLALVGGVAIDHPKTTTGAVVFAVLWAVWAPSGLAVGVTGAGLALFTGLAPVIVIGAIAYGLYLFVRDMSAKRGE
jgi:peptidoglycan/LPS O-acetylase OafA/YrhL